MPRTRTTDDLAEPVAAVREFNRFYTRQIGVLTEHLLQSDFSLAEARVLYEIAHHDGTTATDVGKALDLDAGYLSRLLRSFQRRRLIVRQPSPRDGRQSLLRLTAAGRKTFAMLDARSRAQVDAMVRTLPAADRSRLLGAMQTIQHLLGEHAADARAAAGDGPAPYTLRSHYQPGDLGWVIHRHGVLYTQEYGWDEQFEALVAVIAGQLLQRFDPARERCWIAERDGEIVGFVFLVEQSKTVAKLRLLLVEPKARGLGLGRRLVAECVQFAKQAGYRKITLWTQSNLYAARHLYAEAGFTLVSETPAHSWGADLVSETWELRL